MTKRLLIDASHAEETRVVVLDGNRIEDFDVETLARKQIKGNIYLAKVVRVEPSLQAAFVEYGGNRHGFLAFSEIHPDYYQIPVADRQKLLALQAAAAREDEEIEDAPPAAPPPAVPSAAPSDEAETGTTEAKAAPQGEEEEGEAAEAAAEAAIAAPLPEESDAAESEPPETLGGGEGDAGDEGREPRLLPRFLRQYKIQEVIHRRQIMLVQVVKEERGSKGAALTTYISLAGRFCVLMPNSPRGGGVSRKITSLADRRRLKEVISELGIPDGMSMIVRTAGANRPKPEIKRDGEYLLRLWDEIRETTLSSIAPSLIYEDASLIKRAIRDVYSRDIEEVIVDGEAGWRAAHEMMRLLMPSHARKVIAWQDGGTPLFAHHHIESQLEAVFSPTVQLRSGGYLVINQAEALVAIDVNSGRATRERDIEDTALRTNLEAAEEVARQLRLRDLAGLIVIDFIDMEQRRHNLQVERRLKEALRQDRARIQVGTISHFGLLEMSRQRLRPSLTETSLVPCPHCGGLGHVRSTESAAIHVLRAVEEEGAKRRAAEIAVHAAAPVALYVLNHKRQMLSEIEARFGLRIAFQIDPSLTGEQIRLERLRAASEAEALPRPAPAPPLVTSAAPAASASALTSAPEAEEDDTPVPEKAAGAKLAEGEEHKRRRRRRRGGRKRREEGAAPQAAAEAEPAAGEEPAIAAHEDAASQIETPEHALPADLQIPTVAPEPADATAAEIAPEAASEMAPEIAPIGDHPGVVEAPIAAEPAPEEAPKRRARTRRAPTTIRRRKAAPADDTLPELALPGAPQPDLSAPDLSAPNSPAANLSMSNLPAPAPESPMEAPMEAAVMATPESATADAIPATPDAPAPVLVGDAASDAPRKRGWWRR